MITLLTTLLALGLPLIANESWIALSANNNKHCSAKSPCTLAHKNGRSFKVIADVEKKDGLFELQTLSIEGRKGQKQVFKDFKNFQRFFESETLGLFAVDLNQDGFLDLALQASRSARLGPFYFYWVYNPSKKQFVMTKQQVEELKVVGKNHMWGLGTNQTYRVDGSFQLRGPSSK